MGVLATFRQLLATSGQAEPEARYGDGGSIGQSDGWFVRLIGGGKTKAGVPVSEYSALYLPVVYACVNRIANPIANFPLEIRQRQGGGSVAVNEHPLSQRIGLRPNDYMSSRTLRKTTQGHSLLWGNGYQEIERNRSGQAVGLWPLLPDRTRPHRIDGSLVYRTNIDGKTFEIGHGDVAHVMDLSHDGYVGYSQVAIARQAMGMALALEEFGAKFFANDMKSGGFLMHPGRLSPQARQNVRGPNGEAKASRESPAAAVEKQGGLDNAHRVKVLEEGMKFISTTIPPEDAQFLGTREFQTAEIARMYDVPLVMLQSHEKSTSWGTGIEQLMLGFIRQTVAPWVQATEQEYNWKLFTEAERAKGLFVKFNMNAVLRGDMKARANFYKAMFELGMTINQILALEDMNGIGAEGDINFVSNNVQTLDRAINGDPAPAAASTIVPPENAE
ncbi:MAG TPA: phage portal protein [Xanthobacteraceae bacterium]|nr:phage portal protein [Xanthobacteraceae bacterium]